MSEKQKAYLKAALLAAISGGAAMSSAVYVSSIHELKALAASFAVGFVTTFVAYLAKSPMPLD